MNPNDLDPALTNAPLAWQHATRAEDSGDLLQAAARYLACPPLPGRGTAPAHFHAAWCYERAGRLLEACRHYELSIDQSSDDALTIEAAFRLAWCAIDARDYARAMPRLHQVIELADRTGNAGVTVAHARYWVAVCLELDGELLAAVERYSAIVAAGRPDLWPEAAYRRLLCLSLIGDFERALSAADALLQPAAPAADAARLTALQALAHEERAQILRARETA